MFSEESDQEFCYLYIKGQKIPLKIIEPTMGKTGVDIQPLLGNYDVMSFDPAFKSTASCYSKITYLNGDAGELFHRGYPIEQLAEKCTYLEVCQLLWEGELPSAEAAASFEREIKNHTMVHEQLRDFFKGFPLSSHPMSMMCGVIGSLSAFYHDSLDIQNEEHRRLSAVRLIAKMPTIAAMTYKYSIGQPFMYPRNDLSYVANFLYMMFGTPTEPYVPDPLECEALESIFILHADHEQNASSSTVRIAGSSGADPFACISAGIASLWGPMHGGANQAVIEMLEEIGSPDRIPLFLEKAKDKNDSFRLMGFGHRVYKNFDPRARVIKDLYSKLLASKNIMHDPLFEIAKILEQTALADPYFIERKLYPNVDFYSGLILKMLKIPTSMFTVIFAMGRTVGWISQWNEMISDKKVAIARPQQIYIGPTPRDVPERFSPRR